MTEQKRMTPAELHANLAHFSGSDENYLYKFGGIKPLMFESKSFGKLAVAYSDGAKYLFDHGECRWLLDAIASHMPKVMKNAKYEEFHIWILRKEGNGALLSCVWDSGDNISPIVTQKIPHTDFPFDMGGDFKLYASATTIGDEQGNPINVVKIFLPSER